MEAPCRSVPERPCMPRGSIMPWLKFPCECGGPHRTLLVCYRFRSQARSFDRGPGRQSRSVRCRAFLQTWTLPAFAAPLPSLRTGSLGGPRLRKKKTPVFPPGFPLTNRFEPIRSRAERADEPSRSRRCQHQRARSPCSGTEPRRRGSGRRPATTARSCRRAIR